jgi:hypothetical protein
MLASQFRCLLATLPQYLDPVAATPGPLLGSCVPRRVPQGRTQNETSEVTGEVTFLLA